MDDFPPSSLDQPDPRHSMLDVMMRVFSDANCLMCSASYSRRAGNLRIVICVFAGIALLVSSFSACGIAMTHSRTRADASVPVPLHSGSSLSRNVTFNHEPRLPTTTTGAYRGWGLASSCCGGDTFGDGRGGGVTYCSRAPLSSSVTAPAIFRERQVD